MGIPEKEPVAEPNEILIIVSGGMVQQYIKGENVPKGVIVSILDYDVEDTWEIKKEHGVSTLFLDGELAAEYSIKYGRITYGSYSKSDIEDSIWADMEKIEGGK